MPGDSLGRALIAALSEGVVVSVRATGEVIVNAAAERILGLTPDQLRFGEPPPPGWAMLEADGITPMAEHPARTVERSGQPIRRRLAAVHPPDGDMTWVLISAERYVDPEGSYDGIVMTFTDVTEQHQRQEHDLDEARLRSLDARLNDIEIILGLDGRIVHANDRAVAAYGYTREKLASMTVYDLRAAPTQGDVAGQIQGADAGGIRFQTLHKRSDGTLFPVEVSSRGFTVGGVRYLHSLVRDLTASERADAERRQLEARVADALRERDLILDGSPVGITKVRARRMLWVNHQMSKLLGYSAQELTGASTRPLYLSEDDWIVLGEQAYPVLETGGVFVIERPLVRKDGSRFLARMSARAADPSDPETDSIWIIEDLSDAREAEDRLAEDRLAEDRLAAAEARVRAVAEAPDEVVQGDGAVAEPRKPDADGVLPGAEAPGIVPRASRPAWSPRHGGEASDVARRRCRRLLGHLRAAVLVFVVERDARGRVADWTLLEANEAGRRYYGPGYPFAIGRPATELFGETAMHSLLSATERLLSGEVETADVAFATRNRWFIGTAFAMDERTMLAIADEDAARGQAGEHR
jgi:PAS domain S-box-containing protein